MGTTEDKHASDKAVHFALSKDVFHALNETHLHAFVPQMGLILDSGMLHPDGTGVCDFWAGHPLLGGGGGQPALQAPVMDQGAQQQDMGAFDWLLEVEIPDVDETHKCWAGLDPGAHSYDPAADFVVPVADEAD